MYMVYWSTREEKGTTAHAQLFPSDALSETLAFMETLRRGQRTGEPISFVTMCSENPDSVGSPGVADAPPDYAWKKRRQ